MQPFQITQKVSKGLYMLLRYGHFGFQTILHPSLRSHSPVSHNLTHNHQSVFAASIMLVLRFTLFSLPNVLMNTSLRVSRHMINLSSIYQISNDSFHIYHPPTADELTVIKFYSLIITEECKPYHLQEKVMEPNIASIFACQ